MKRDIRTAVSSILGLTLLLGILYPLAIAGVGQGVFPGNANGQLVYRHGRLIGSQEIGQQFTDLVHTGSGEVKMRHGVPVTVPDPRYFQTRPSGTVPADNAAATTFANLGPNDRLTARTLAANAKAYLALNRPYDRSLTLSQVPVDAVDTSASGIDPDISPANAAIQAHRVAAVRHLPLATVMALVHRFTGGRGLGFSGEPSVNVLELNLALDRAHP
ncbi:MAG TPA: potassium-transporting ATPase subunit C [Solirubrobacteraceae bacterium]|nr:potassium-transporting ATPase subunit C [Solirubrobacteraceae bacterium]